MINPPDFDSLPYLIGEKARELSESRLAYRRGFSGRLSLTYDALYFIIKVDEGDFCKHDDESVIMKCITHQQILSCLVDDAKNVKKELESLLKKAK